MTYFKQAAIIIAAITIAASAAQAETALIEKSSPYSVTETAGKLTASAKEKGLRVYAHIDHKAQAKKIGRMMGPSQVVIVGNPSAAARVAWHDPRAMLDLPVRVLIYQDTNDKTQLIYRRPTALNKEFTTTQCATIPEIETRINAITDAAVK